MKNIVPMGKIVSMVLGKQKIQDMEYRILKYCVIKETKDGRIIYNLMTQEMILLNIDEVKSLETLPGKVSPQLTKLVEKWFIVPVNQDDKKICQELRSILGTIMHTDHISNFTILPTTECNARCFYCYEAGCRHSTMTGKKAHDVARYIVEKSRGNEVLLEWFGGEPLCNYDVIDIICSDLRSEGVLYKSILISNGLLFDHEIIKKATSLWNLLKVQVPLDGTEKIYNQTKRYIHTEGSPYKRVMDNIVSLLQAQIKVDVRMNIGEHNYQDLTLLCMQLSEMFKGNKNFHVYAEMLFEEKGFCPKERSEESRKNLYKKFLELESTMKKLGILWEENPKPVLPLHSCSADDNSAVVISPDGTLRKCGCLLDSRPFGHIENEIVDEDTLTYWNEKKASIDACDSCVFYPVCVQLKNCPILPKAGCTAEFRMRRMKKTERIIENSLMKFAIGGESQVFIK